MRYTENQWAMAEWYWSQRMAPKEVEAQTGISRNALYKNLPKRGQPRMASKDLQRLKADWDAGIKVPLLVQKYGRCRSRIYQLAEEQGWDARHHDTRETPEPVLTPQWKRCCGQKLPYVSRCPQCEEPV